MRIAIIGAPTSGKSDLAKSMARSLNRENKGRWKVIDGYVEDLSKRTGVSYGDAGYVENVQVMSYRWLLEDEAAHSEYSTITCGSIYETFTYSAMLNIKVPPDEQAALYQWRLISIMMNFFHAVEPSGRYDHLFYLPINPHEHSWHGVLNAKLPEILFACGVTATVLDGTKREKLQSALKITRFIRDEIYGKQAEEMAKQR